MLQLTLRNPNEIKNLNRRWKKAIDDGIDKGLKAVGMHLVSVIKEDIKDTSPGSVRKKRYYGGGKRSKMVHVSPPGTSPNTDTGDLISSITYTQNSTSSIIVGSTSKKGLWLNYGAKGPGNRILKPRPFLEPNAEKEKSKMAELLMEQVETSFKKGY